MMSKENAHVACGNPEHSSIEIKLKRVDRIYRPGETVQGSIAILAKDGWSHQGLEIEVRGQVRPGNKNASSEMQSPKGSRAVVMLRECLALQPAGRFAAGSTEVPFSFELPTEGMHESYHGVHINVAFELIAVVERGGFKRGLRDSKEFIVEVPEPARESDKPKLFEIKPENLENVNASTAASISKFSITGRLFHQVCPINLPFTGEITIQESEAPIKSIELQLVRVETVRDERTSTLARESTEVQNIQISDGDVCRNLVIPMYMVFPRLYTCPTMKTAYFGVEFEVTHSSFSSFSSSPPLHL